MSLAERKWLRLFTLCALYVAQGIPWGFTATTIPAYLAAQGLSPEAIGIALTTTTLPYSFKWVWGPIIDAFTLPRFGRRRPWILFAQLMMAVTIISMIAIPDLTADLNVLRWVILIHTVFNSLQDVAVDALAVDLLDDDERGRANGLMYASKYGGGFIGGAGMSAVIVWTSLQTALVVQTAILLAIMLVPLLVRETERPLARRPRMSEVIDGLAEVFAVRSALVTAGLMLTINLSLGVLTASGFALFTQELHWTQQEYTSLTGGLGLLAGLGGSVIGGFLSDVVGRRKLAASASIVMAAGWLAFGLATSLWSTTWFVYGLALVEAVCTSIMTVSLFALCMDVSWWKTGASQFTAYMALSNFSMTLGFRITGELPASFGFAERYLAAAGLQVAVTAILFAIDPHEVRRRLPAEDAAAPPVARIAGRSWHRGHVTLLVLGAVLASMTLYIVSGLL